MTHTLRPAVEQLERRDTPATIWALAPAEPTSVESAWLLKFDSANPSVILSSTPLRAFSPRGRIPLVALDYNPRTGHFQFMGVSTDRFGSTSGLFFEWRNNGQMRNVRGVTLTGASANPDAADYDIEYDPATHAVRVTNSEGFNGRSLPFTSPGSVHDTPVNPSGQVVSGAAHDRNFYGKLGPNGSTLYTVNAATGTLQTQGGLNGTPSPDTGTQFVVGPLGVPIDPTGRVGFDIAANSAAAAGPAFASFDGDPGAGVSTGLYSIDLTSGAATRVGTIGDGSTRLLGIAIAPESRFAVGSGAGTDSRVEVRDGSTGTVRQTFNPFPGFLGGVAVAVGDVNRDSVPDTIAGALAGGGPHVRVFDGATGAELYSFFAYDPAFRGGVSVSSGDINDDGYADLLIGAGPGGGPHVKAFSGKDLSELASFMAFDVAFRGGVNVAAADFDQNGTAEMVTAAGAGGGPHVKVFARDLVTGTVGLDASKWIMNNFFAYDISYRGGVNVAAGMVDTYLGQVNIITSPGADAHLRSVKVFTGAFTSSEFTPFDTTYTGGVRVGVGDVDGDGWLEVLTTGPGTTLRAFITTNVQSTFPTVTQVKELDVLAGASGVTVGG